VQTVKWAKSTASGSLEAECGFVQVRNAIWTFRLIPSRALGLRGAKTYTYAKIGCEADMTQAGL
jgi:hypothetical protein